jgi:hypothetical protein
MLLEISGGVFRLTLKSNNRETEYAYFTEDMLHDNLAIYQQNFTAEFESKTILTLRHCTGEFVAEYEIYYGEAIFPIQLYRIIKDIFDLFDRLMPEDFTEVVTEHLSRSHFFCDRQNRDSEGDAKLADDIREFFKKIQLARL